MAGSGGFIALSPPPSSVASSSVHHALPQPRSSPLKPGGTKESSFIRYVDQKILHIQRRFAKRDPSLDLGSRVRDVDEEGRLIAEVGDPAFATASAAAASASTSSLSSSSSSSRLAPSEEWYDVPGYTGFAEAAKDVEELVGLTWVTATPSLQIPYLISLALLTSVMIPAFPAAPHAMFRLLGKLDHAFASLLQGRDIESGDQLPGFSMSRGINGTEKVRIKSLVERSRVCVVDVMSKGDFEEMEESGDETPPQSDIEGDLILDEPETINVDDDAEDENWDMQVAKVYDRTIVELGSTMEGPEIGIRTEPVTGMAAG